MPLRGPAARRAAVPRPSCTVSPPRSSRDGFGQGGDAVRSTQEGGWSSLGPMIQNGQRPPDSSRRVPGLSLPASVHPHSPAHAQQLPLRAKLLSQTASVARLESTTRNRLPPASVLPTSSREGAQDPLGWSTSYHNGPQRPQASSCPGLGTHATHRPGLS